MYLSHFSYSLIFIQSSARTATSTIWRIIIIIITIINCINHQGFLAYFYSHKISISLRLSTVISDSGEFTFMLFHHFDGGNLSLLFIKSFFCQ